MEPIHSITLSALIDSSPFWSSFLAQLLATLIVVIIGSVIVPPILRWNERAKMIFVKANTSRGNNFKFIKSKDGLWKSIIHLSVKNLGKKTIERFYWEMYIEKDLIVDIMTKPPYPKEFTTHRQVGDKFIRIYGYIEMPIFSLSDIDFVFEIRLEAEEIKQKKIYYCFKTDYGDSPVWTKYALIFKKYSWLKSLTIT